jgi:ABC-type uncharacterized transport system permease subunit
LIAYLQLAAALYLGAGIAGGLAMALGAGWAARVALALVGAGALAQVASLVALHAVEPTPSLTELPLAVSLMAWMVAIVFLVFAAVRRARLGALAVLVGPVAFLGAFFAATRTPHEPAENLVGAGGWPHVHVLLASAGLALLAVAAIAGAVYLLENRRLKRKRPQGMARAGLPSLEALDRVNAVALAVGFPLLTLGVASGMLWLEAVTGQLWTGTAHEAWNALAWLLYAVLAGARFLARQGARDAAASAVAGFVFLLFAVVGVGMFT